MQDSRPASDKCAMVFKTTALPIRLIFRKEKLVRSEAKTFVLCSVLELGRHASVLFGELRIWRSTFCRLKLRACENFGVSDGI